LKTKEKGLDLIREHTRASCRRFGEGTHLASNVQWRRKEELGFIFHLPITIISLEDCEMSSGL
jgi:hypothetical protein